MKSYHHILALMLVALLTISGAHSAEQNKTIYLPLVSRSSLPPIVSSSTIVLSETTMAVLKDASSNGLLIFTKMTPDLAKIKVGSVIVSAPATTAPDGLMRKVIGLTTQSGQLTLQTRQAAIDEVFDQIELTVNGSIPLNPSTTTTTSAITQGSTASCAPAAEYQFDVTGGVSFDLNTNIQPPTFHFEVAKGKGLSVQHLQFTTSASADIHIRGNISANAVAGPYNVDLLKCKLSPIVVIVGGLPIPLVPVFSLTAGIKIEKSNGGPAYNFDASATGQFTAGIDYLNGKTTIINVSQGATKFDRLPPEKAGAFKPFTGFRGGILIAGLLGAEAGVDTYARWAEASPNSFFVGLEAVVSVVTDIIFIKSSILETSFTLFEHEFSAPPIITLTPIPVPDNLIDLGDIGGSIIEAHSINNSDQVVGFSDTSKTPEGLPHAFLWQNGIMHDLGTFDGSPLSTSFANGINNLGQVVGAASGASSGGLRAFLWQNGTMTNLGALGGNYSYATSINNVGQVVGYSEIADHSDHAFLWQNGVMKDIGTIDDFADRYATSINDAGQVVGYVAVSSFGTPIESFLWQNGVMTRLISGTASRAYSINNAGQVVGYMAVDRGSKHAFLWQNGVVTDLGTLGGSESIAYGINDAGQIVGTSSTASGVEHAFLWQNGMMTDLGSLGMLSIATSINLAGHVAGYSAVSNPYIVGAERGFFGIPRS